MTKNTTILHNPRCQKSRQALEILNQYGLNPTIRLYLQDPLNKGEIAEILKKGDFKIEDIIRKKESIYQELSERTIKNSDWIEHIAKHPVLLERPIIITDDEAIVARDQEKLVRWIGQKERN
jgi:arsenate reductase (glutaredoxin)